MELQKTMQVMAVRRFAFLDQEPEIVSAPLPLSDYLLGPFDDELLGEDAPDFYLEEWCPPPLAYTESEMQQLLAWVDRERDKGDLYPDPATYPFDDYFDREDLNVIQF